MKCLVIETSNARPYSAARPVTNEDGTPHVYATMTEARAELKANGYSYNREAKRYYIKGTDARAYIVREDSDEYAEYMEPNIAVDITAYHYADADEYGTIRSLCLDELKLYSAAYVYEDSDKGIRYIVSRAADNDRGNPFSGLWVCEVEDLEGGFIWNCAGNTPQAAFNKMHKRFSASPTETDHEPDAGSDTATDSRANILDHIKGHATKRGEYAFLGLEDLQPFSAVYRFKATAEGLEYIVFCVAGDSETEYAAMWAGEAYDLDGNWLCTSSPAENPQAAFDAAAEEMERRHDCAVKQATRDWSGAGWYDLGWSDGGTAKNPVYFEAEDELAAEYVEMYQGGDEFHTPICEHLGDGEAPADMERGAYDRAQLVEYLGEPDAYDVEAIEAEATTYVYAEMRTYWKWCADLAAIAERHELYTYAPVA